MKIIDLISHLRTIAEEHGNLEVLSDGFYHLRKPQVIEARIEPFPAEWNIPDKFVRLRMDD